MCQEMETESIKLTEKERRDMDSSEGPNNGLAVVQEEHV